MKRTFWVGVTAGILLATGLQAAPVSHYVEAEDFKGNAYVAPDKNASGGKILVGKTWYVFLDKLPIPQNDGKSLNCFVRMRSSLKAYWFLAYNPAQPFGWCTTPGDDKWVWIKIGTFKANDTNKGLMPRLFLQKPIGSTAQTTDGAVDAVVFTDSDDVKVVESLFQNRITPAAAIPAKEDTAKAASLAGVHRFYSVKKAPKAPVLDGELDDDVYSLIPAARDFMLLTGNAMASQQTTVKVLQYGEDLYFAVNLAESKMPFIRALRSKDGDSVWTDDCFELYLDPGQGRKKAFQLIVNPNGAKQDNLKSRIDEAGFSDLKLTWQTVVKRKGDRWCAEIKIPLKLITFAPVHEGTVWGVNFCRSEIPFNEKSYWNNTGDYFLKPDRYGILYFGEAPGNPQAVSVDAEKHQMKIRFFPKSEEKVELSGHTEGKDGGAIHPQTISLTPGTQEIALPITGSGKFTAFVNLKSGEKSGSFAIDVKNYKEGLQSCLWPCEERKDRLPILYGTAQHAFWLLANHTKKTLDEIDAVILVPEGITLLDPTTDVEYPFYRRCKLTSKEPVIRDKKKYTRYTIRLVGKLGPVNLSSLAFYNGITVFFQCNDPKLIGKKLPFYCNLRSGSVGEDEHCYTMEILPAPKGMQPKKLMVHDWLWTFYPYTGCFEPCLKTLKAVGVNSVDGGGSQRRPGSMNLYKKYQISLINNMFWHFNAKTTPETCAVKFDGRKDARRLCPTKMLAGDGKLLLETLKVNVADIAAGSMGIVWDLEGPYCWECCFCPACIATFRKYAKIDAGVALTPKIIREKYNSRWIDYCCHQTTEISAALRKACHKINPNSQFGFYSGLPSFDTRESYRADWYDAAPHIDLALLSYYANSSVVLDETFNQKMKEHIKNLKVRAGSNPLKVWATLTPGYGRNQSMNPPPELIKLKVLRSFASGADGVSFWWWGPFDGDYYQSLAEATQIAAKYESFFLAGEKEISLKIASASVKRYSTFTSKVGDQEFMLLLNHSSASMTVTLKNPSEKNFADEIAGKNYSDHEFKVIVPASDAIALLAK